MRTHVLFVLMLLFSCAPAFGQNTPAVEFGGGYSFVRDQEIEKSFHGWLASVAGNYNSWLGIVGEIGGNYNTTQIAGTDLDLSLYSFLAGPRLSFRSSSSTTPFAHVLIGVTRRSVSLFGESESDASFTMQPGGGVDFWFRPNLALRVGADYRRLFEDGGTNEFRFQVGIVYAIGSR